MAEKTYDTTLARIAGNIAAGLVTLQRVDVAWEYDRITVAEYAVDLARLVLAEIRRTEPADL